MKQEDWQLGPNSTLSPTERMLLHNEWLQGIHEELRNKIFKGKEIEKPEESIGGFDD